MKQHKKRALLAAVWEAQGRACYICDKAMDLPAGGPAPEPHEATRDHVHPRALNGSPGWGNILLAHLKCNRKKGDRPPTEREMARLHTTLQALEPWALKLIMDSALNTLEAARERERAATEEARHAAAAASLVMRYAPTADVESILERLASASLAKPATA